MNSLILFTMIQIPTLIKKRILTILLSIFLVPFVLVIAGDIIDSDKPLYTFGLGLKDFFTMWIAVFGVFGVVYNISQNQRRISQQENQLSLQHQSERNSRFAKGVELLGNSQESARTGGVYSLIFLAKEYPEEYKESVFDILCSHIRTITNTNEYKKEFQKSPSNEVQTIVNLLFKSKDCFFEGLDADLSGSYLYRIDLSKTTFYESDFSHAILTKADLSGMTLTQTLMINSNLINARLTAATLTGVDFSEANLTEAILVRATLIGGYYNDTKIINTNFTWATIFDLSSNLAKAIIKDPILKNTKGDISALNRPA